MFISPIYRWLSALLLLTTVSAHGNGHVQALPSVVSINMCADQLVMLLAHESQIKALSNLSQDKAGSYYHERAKQYAQVNPRAEEILPLNPDVVLTGPFAARHTLNMLAELELKTVSLSVANSIEEMVDNLRLVGTLLGKEEAADSIIEDIDSRLSDIQTRVTSIDKALLESGKKRHRAAIYDANGYTSGNDSLRGEAMNLAGWHNVASDIGIASYGVIHLENLIRLKPEALILSPYSKGTFSRAQMVAKHPSIRKSGLDPILVNLPSNQSICAGPWSVNIIETLLDAQELIN